MNEFRSLISDILESEAFQSTKLHIHHGQVSTYKHSVTVAYMCYLHHKRKQPKYDIREYVRGALLHDFYLYDWHHTGEGHRLHGFRHPFFAYKNAQKYFEVTPLMKDIILHHMFPLLPFLPRSKAAWSVQHYDKAATRRDYRKRKHQKKNSR